MDLASRFTDGDFQSGRLPIVSPQRTSPVSRERSRARMAGNPLPRPDAPPTVNRDRPSRGSRSGTRPGVPDPGDRSPGPPTTGRYPMLRKVGLVILVLI